MKADFQLYGRQKKPTANLYDEPFPDVRTPLTTLLGYSDAITQETGHRKRPNDYVETARRKSPGDLKEYIDVLFDWFS